MVSLVKRLSTHPKLSIQSNSFKNVSYGVSKKHVDDVFHCLVEFLQCTYSSTILPFINT